MRLNIILILIAFLSLSCSENMEETNMEPELNIEAPDNQSDFVSKLSNDSSKLWINDSFRLEVFGELDCRKDDKFTFFSDGTFEYDGGALLCGDADNQQIVRGNWELDLENGMIIFNKGTEDEESAKYITVRENELRVQGSWNGFLIDAMYKTE